MSLKPGDRIKHDPDGENDPYVMNWTRYLATLPGTGDDTIAESEWIIEGPDDALENADDSIVDGALKTQIKLTGGTAGARYTLTNRITTVGGVIDDRSITVLVGNQ